MSGSVSPSAPLSAHPPLRRGLLAAIVALGAVLLAAPGPGHAATLTFTAIGQVGGANAEILEEQIRLTVTEHTADPGQAVFRFENLGEQPSTLSRFYIDDRDHYLDFFVTTARVGAGSAGVNFVAAPGHPGPSQLTGGRQVGFETSTRLIGGREVAFSAGAAAPAHRNGIDAGAFLDVPIFLADEISADQVIGALEGNQIQVGVYVDFARGGGSSAVLVPEPTTFASLALVLGVLTTLRRR